jgi:hypothetical protein
VTSGCAATDHRGVRRPVGRACDAGAYEVKRPAPVVTLPATGVQATFATPRASVNPNGPVTTVTFQYGRTTHYGSVSAPKLVGPGFGAVTVATRVGRLPDGRAMHFRAVARSADGGVVGSDRTFKTRRGITALSVRPKRFRPGRRARIRFRLAEAASVRLVFDRRRGGRWRRAGSQSRKSKVGRDSVRFSGRLRGKPLDAGRYRVRLQARVASNKALRPRRAQFRILRIR